MIPHPDLALRVVTDLLEQHPQRLAHSVAVQNQLLQLMEKKHKDHPAELSVAGLLHDIGHAFPTSDIPALDGADLVRELGWEELAPHIAHHSTARHEAETLGRQYRESFTAYSAPDPISHSLLWVANYTTSPTGEPVSITERLHEIMQHSPEHSSIARSLRRSLPDLQCAVTILGHHGYIDLKDPLYAVPVSL